MEPSLYYENTFDISVDSFFPAKNDVVSTKLTLTWGNNDLIQQFHLQLATDKNFSESTLIINDDTLTSTSYSVLLEKATTYYWRIKFKMDNNWKTWYEPIKFSTIDPNSDELIVSPHFTTDGFEINDGTFSTLYNWNFTGDVAPFVQTQTVHSGSYAARFGTIKPQQKSGFQIKVSLDESKDLRFWYKMGIAGNFTDFDFLIDGSTLLDNRSNKWTEFKTNLTAGEHILTWNLDNWYSYNTSADTGWIDDISLFYAITAMSPESGSVIQDTTPLLSWTIKQGATRYHLRISEDVNFSEPLLVDNDALNTSKYQVSTGLQLGKTYYWRFRFIDNKGTWTEWSPDFSFMVDIGGFVFKNAVALSNTIYYLADNSNYRILKADYGNDTIEEVMKLNYAISSLCLTPNKQALYVSAGASIWKYDIQTNIKTSIATTPETIYNAYLLNDDYLISNDSSGAWSTNRLIRLIDNTEVDSQDWLDPSASYVYAATQHRIYILRDDSSPNDLLYQEIDFTNELLLPDHDSIYHGNYSYSHPLKLFPDESKVITASGYIFNANDSMSYVADFQPYIDLVFYNGYIFLLCSENDNQTSVHSVLKVLDANPPYNEIATVYTYDDSGKKLVLEGDTLSVITQVNKTTSYNDPWNTDITIHRYSVSALIAGL